MRYPNIVGVVTIGVAYFSTVSAIKANYGGFAQAPYQNFSGVYRPSTNLYGSQTQPVQSGVYTSSTIQGSQIHQTGTFNPVNTQMDSFQSTPFTGTYNPFNSQLNSFQSTQVTGTSNPNNPFNQQNSNYQGIQAQQGNQVQPAQVTGPYNPNNPFNPPNLNYQGQKAIMSGTYDPYKNANKPFEPACGNVNYSGNEGATGTGLSDSMMSNMLGGQNVHINQHISGDGEIANKSTNVWTTEKGTTSVYNSNAQQLSPQAGLAGFSQQLSPTGSSGFSQNFMDGILDGQSVNISQQFDGKGNLVNQSAAAWTTEKGTTSIYDTKTNQLTVTPNEAQEIQHQFLSSINRFAGFSK